VSTLEVRHLSKSFGEKRAVDGISFTAASGAIFGLVGRNGAGKTTTIRTIMNIYLPDAGTITLGGKPSSESIRDSVGYLPEERGLYKKMSIMDNLMFLAEIKGMSAKEARPIAMRYLERFDLAKSANAVVDSLSKGNQQKVQFIGTIIHDPMMVILDEPFSGLDPVNTNLFKDVILTLKSAGKIVILSTHQMDIAEKLCDHIALINSGKLLLNAPLSEIKKTYSQSVASIEADGDTSFITSLPYVQSAQAFGSKLTVRVNDNADVQPLLIELVRRNVKIRRFQAEEMSLHDIFVSLTRTESEILADEGALQSPQLEIA
jgi:ABC-2 type transport system ATP-binding protein